MDLNEVERLSLKLAQLVERERAAAAELDAVVTEKQAVLTAIASAATDGAVVPAPAGSRKDSSKKAAVEQFVASLDPGTEITPNEIAELYSMSPDMASNYLSGLAKSGKLLRRISKGKYLAIEASQPM